MIFISYNHKDEQLVDMVARRLELEFGRNNIFYDKWSIQPGDSIIGKMNERLDAFTTFFFFLSPNSLTSKMVTKEWQSALAKAISNNLKFVPVRIAECDPPAILTDTLYVDRYGIGLDDAVAQMKCVIRGQNSYAPLQDISNLCAIIENLSPQEIKVEIHAHMYSENNNRFAFILDNSPLDFDVEPQGVPMHVSASHMWIPEKLMVEPGIMFRAKARIEPYIRSDNSCSYCFYILGDIQPLGVDPLIYE